MINCDQPALPTRILIVDDEISTRTAICRALQLSGYIVDNAEDGEHALKLLKETEYDVMLLDLNMPVMNGEQVMDVVREQYPDLQVIILTAHATLNSAITAVKTGAVDFLLKPQSISQIDLAIQKAIKRGFSQSKRQHLIDIIGEAMHTLQAEEDKTQYLNHVENNSITKPIEFNGMIFDPVQRKLITSDEIGSSDSKAVRTSDLTAVQSAILMYMVLHPMHVLSCIEISREALGYHNLTQIEAENIIRPHIVKLRRKIEVDPSTPRLIRSVRGKGYIFSQS